MIQVVPTGDIGLDVLLGGGWRLIERLPDYRSATVLIRGGAGSGKTLLGIDVALAMAGVLGGDVAVGCVEILPSEYVAQLRSARTDLDESRIVMLPGEAANGTGPRIFCGLLTDLDPSAPDLVACLESLRRDVESLGGLPKVFIVDSLSEGYGIGSSAHRVGADAVMKFAAQGGHGLVLCEETAGEQASPWLFAADTVLELGVESRERGRWIEVRKHRFGPSVSGRHELELGSGTHPKVFPEPHAWVAGRPETVLQAHGWEFTKSSGIPQLIWHGKLDPLVGDTIFRGPFEARFTLVTSGDSGLARTMALGLLPQTTMEGRDLIVELDPVVIVADYRSEAAFDRYVLPTMHGSARALRGLIEYFARQFTSQVGTQVRRVVLGDLGCVLGTSDKLQWIDAVRVLVSLLAESEWCVTVIGYSEAGPDSAAVAARSLLGSYSDLRINLIRENTPDSGRRIVATFTQRWRRLQSTFVFGHLLDANPLPQGFDELDRSPGSG
jgi:KaiC/GvpD/RAD55 family RecA-like ATPase